MKICFIRVICGQKRVEMNNHSIKPLRGKYRGHLSSSDEFSRRKQHEKKLERCFTKKPLRQSLINQNKEQRSDSTFTAGDQTSINPIG